MSRWFTWDIDTDTKIIACQSRFRQPITLLTFETTGNGELVRTITQACQNLFVCLNISDFFSPCGHWYPMHATL